MRKISPEDVRDDFKAKLVELRQFHDTGFPAFTKAADQSIFTERSLLATAVTWEGFVSDIFIAFINRDATKFKEHLQASFDQHLKAGATPKRVFETFGVLTFPEHLSKEQVQALADNAGKNITFPNFDDLERQAKNWLISAHASKFTGLSAQQKAVINSVIALRNHVAHRSKRSLDAMNDTLAKGVLHRTGLKPKNNRFHNVGAWLKATPVGRRETRSSLIMAALDGIAANF